MQNFKQDFALAGRPIPPLISRRPPRLLLSTTPGYDVMQPNVICRRRSLRALGLNLHLFANKLNPRKFWGLTSLNTFS